MPITFTRAVNNWFFAGRGLALGIALVMTGMFGALSKIFAQQVITHYDWRTAYIAVGALPLLIALPLIIAGFRDVTDKPAAESLGAKLKTPLSLVSIAAALGFVYVIYQFLAPKVAEFGWRLEYITTTLFAVLALLVVFGFGLGRVKGTTAALTSSEKVTALSGLSLKEAIKDWRYWLLAVAFEPISFALGRPIPNLELILKSKGFTADDAVGLAGLIGFAVICGRILGGYLIDKFWAPAVAIVFLASPAIALMLFTSPDLSREAAMISIFMIGFGAGVEYDFMAYLVSRYFGMKSYGAIYGSLYGFFAVGAGFGPVIISNWYHQHGSFDGIFPIAAGVLVAGSLMLPLLGKYRNFSAPSPEGDAGQK